MYIEWIIAVNCILAIGVLHVSAKILFKSFSVRQLIILLLLASGLVLWPLLAGIGIVLVILFSFKKDYYSTAKFFGISFCLLLVVGGALQLVQQSPLWTIGAVICAICCLRIGRSTLLSHHTKKCVREIHIGSLRVQAFWDSGNLCTEPISSLPVHFIRQELLDQYPSLFIPTNRRVAASSISDTEFFTLVKPAKPLYCHGKPLAPCYIAPFTNHHLPLDTDMLLHHYS